MRKISVDSRTITSTQSCVCNQATLRRERRACAYRGSASLEYYSRTRKVTHPPPFTLFCFCQVMFTIALCVRANERYGGEREPTREEEVLALFLSLSNWSRQPAAASRSDFRYKNVQICTHFKAAVTERAFPSHLHTMLSLSVSPGALGFL